MGSERSERRARARTRAGRRYGVKYITMLMYFPCLVKNNLFKTQ
jgi:hypothetical protein